MRARPSTLTQRQHEVLVLVAKGMSNAEIADLLGISRATVKSHVETILRVLEVTNRAEAAGLLHVLQCQESEGSALATFSARPAIAVVRFDADSESTAARAFASGLVDDLIMLLCKWGWFPVISKGTSDCYGGNERASKLRELLGVSYVMGGSVVEHGDRLHVRVRLEDARCEECLWAERFDLPAGEIFALQDEIASAVVARAYPELFEAEARAARDVPTSELSAWQLAHLGLLDIETDQPGNARALEYFERASDLDPRFVLPLYGKGLALFQRITNQWSNQIAEDAAEHQRTAERALKLDSNDASGWVLAGRGSLMIGDINGAIPLLQRAAALNPSHARAHSYLGQALAASGHRAGLDHLRLAARLCPRVHARGLPLAHFAFGEYEEAASIVRVVIATQPQSAFMRAILCAALALGGDASAARRELARLRQYTPDFRLANLYAIVPPGQSDVSDRLAEGLRRTGLPE